MLSRLYDMPQRPIQCRFSFLHWLIWIGVVLGIVGCAGASPPATKLLEINPTATTVPAAAEATFTVEGLALTPEVSQEKNVESDHVLRIWLPPQFDPQEETAAGKLLRARLEQFAARYPGIRLEVRIKAESGPGGLLAALSAASVSAPLTLPDVVALPRVLLEAAALKGVVYPMDGLPVAEVNGFLTEPDWFPFAVQMGRLQEITFGLPFASDLLVLAAPFAPSVASPTPETLPSATPTLSVEGMMPGVTLDWNQLFGAQVVLAFPAADPQALFTLVLYRSAGGRWVDEEGRPFLDAALLEQVLNLYQQASQAEVLPYWLSQFETEEQAWEAFRSGEANYVAGWLSQVLIESQQSETPLLIGSLPTLNGRPYSFARGWVWAVASPEPERRVLAGELAAFLVESAFLANWNAAIGYVPPRFSALTAWQPADWRDKVAELSAAAELLPPADILAILGPSLQQATVGVLKLQVDPATAANAVIATLNSP